MFNLVIIVISIALMTTLLATTLNYVPVEAQLRLQMFKEAEQGVKLLEAASVRYLSQNKNSFISNTHDGDSLINVITPDYGFMPSNVRKELTWNIYRGQINGGAGGIAAVGICLQPATGSTPLQRDVLLKLQAQFPLGSTFIGSTCNSTSNIADGTTLTYWVPVSHVN